MLNRFWMTPNGYLETTTDVERPEFEAVPQRPSPDHESTDGAWVYVEPPELFPPLTPFQFWAQMEIEGLTASVEGSIDAISDAAERAVARARLNKSTSFNRDHPLIAQLSAVLGITDEQMDAMWRAAAAIE